MDFLKKNLFVIISGIFVVLSLVVSGVIVSGYNTEIQKYEKEVKLIIQAEQGFVKSPYALTKDNVEQAEENGKNAEIRFVEAIKTLQEKYPEPEISAEMTALKFKLYLRQACIRMENLIRGEDIRMPNELKWFSYDNYMKPDVLPSDQEIGEIMQQLEIVQELMFIISQSDLQSLQSFKRLSGFKATDRTLYKFTPFELSVTGEMKAIRDFLNSVVEAKYYFMVRTVDFVFSSPKRTTTPNFDDAKNKALSKQDRLVYDSSANVKAVVLLDYFEFPH